MTFDEQVAALRGKVEPRAFKGRKSDATPEQWAASLDRLRTANAKYRATAKGKARSRAQNAAWRRTESGREKERASNARWRASQAGKEAGREYALRYRASGKAAQALRRWRESGKAAQWERSRRSGSVTFRLSSVLRCRLRDAVRGRSRSGSAIRDLGCSVADLKANLERQFLPGMTWDNWGKGPGQWQIDHIYPLAKADLLHRLSVLAVCNWRNLQPMWFEDNVRKGDTVTPEAQQLFDGLVSEFSQQEEVCDEAS